MASGGLFRNIAGLGKKAGRIAGRFGKNIARLPGKAYAAADKLPGQFPELHKVLAGESGKELRFDRFNEQQQQALSDILGQSMQKFQGSDFDFDFGPIADRARDQFSKKTVPSLAERFAGMDAMGTGAFATELGEAGAGLEAQLAGMESQYGLEQNRLLQSLMGLGLTPQFETMYQPRQQGILEGGARAGLGGLSSLAGLFGI